jgi:signal transduction histidine kinase
VTSDDLVDTVLIPPRTAKPRASGQGFAFMERPLRIVVAGPVDDRLVGDLRQLPLRPEVRPVATLLAEGEVVLRTAPDLVLVAFGKDSGTDEEIGALRMLQRLWPDLGVVVVTSPEREVAAAAIAQRLHAPLLPFPEAPGQLAATIEQALQRGDRPRADAFVDLARGVADEINNPLMFVSGHLQLLRADLQAAAERNRRDQIAAALAGIDKVQTAVDRLRAVAAAAGGPGPRTDVDLREVLAQTLASTAHRAEPACTIDDGPQVVRGDRGQLLQAIAAIVRLREELHAAGASTELHLRQLGPGRCLRLTARGAPLAAWSLPQSFEPYYPARALRGQSQGLGLFLAQTVVLGHRGQATARRQTDGGVLFEFVLPA